MAGLATWRRRAWRRRGRSPDGRMHGVAGRGLNQWRVPSEDSTGSGQRRRAFTTRARATDTLNTQNSGWSRQMSSSRRCRSRSRCRAFARCSSPERCACPSPRANSSRRSRMTRCSIRYSTCNRPGSSCNNGRRCHTDDSCSSRPTPCRRRRCRHTVGRPSSYTSSRPHCPSNTGQTPSRRSPRAACTGQ